MTTIVTRTGKGSPLTHVEVDTNFTNLNTAKLEAGAIALGSAAAPSISFVSDTNTGIFSPGADQVAISTNGVQRLSIGSTGNIDIDSNTVFVDAVNNRVGIGTSSPSSGLHVYGNGASGYILSQGTAANQWLTLGGNFSDPVIGYPSAGSLRFGTTTDSVFGGFVERFRVDSSGRVGIGTTSPGSALEINAAAATSPFIAKINTAEAARIDSSGRLLVGTSSVSGLDAAKTVVKETTAAAVQRLIGNAALAGGDAQKITIVRSYSVASVAPLGTKLIIPFVSQVGYNLVTLCKVTGLRDEFNSNSPLPFEINFAVGHTNTLFNLSSYGGQGNFASIAASGLNVEITFTTAYTTGIMVCIEYMTAAPTLSINVPNIAMN